MKKVILIVGMVACGLLGLAKIWGLVFFEFSAKQAVYAALVSAAAVLLFIELRSTSSGRR